MTDQRFLRLYMHKLSTCALILVCIAATPAWPAFDETYKLNIGGNVTDFDTTLRINSRDDSVDNEIELEEDLGFSDSVQLGFIRGFWRMGERHRLSLLYTPLRRSSEVTTQNDIDVGGNTIKAGAYVDTTVKTHVFDIEYVYSFYKRPNIELGVTAGLYWMNSSAELNAAGEVIIEGETEPEFYTDYKANQRLIAPLPLIGLIAGYEINDSWRVKAQVRLFDVTINDIEGRLFSSSLATEYFFTDHVGLGTSLVWFDLSVRYNGVVFYNSLGYEYQGVQLYMTFKH